MKAAYPQLVELRRKYYMLLKLVDLYSFSTKERILYTDSDVLFFRRPDFLLTTLLNSSCANYFNKDLDTSYIAAPDIIKSLTGIEPPERINAGLSVLHRDDIETSKVAQILARLGCGGSKEWSFYDHLIEQTTVSLLTTTGGYGAEHLPEEYDVSLVKLPTNSVCKHYVGVIRHQYELEGLNYLIRQKRFFERWKDFAHPI